MYHPGQESNVQKKKNVQVLQSSMEFLVIAKAATAREDKGGEGKK